MVQTRRAAHLVEVRATGRSRARVGGLKGSRAVQCCVRTFPAAPEVVAAAPVILLPVRAPIELVPAKVPDDETGLLPGLAWTPVEACDWLAAAACVLPLAMRALVAASAFVPELACTPDLFAEAEAPLEVATLFCEFAEVCATAVPTMRLPKTSEARMILIAIAS